MQRENPKSPDLDDRADLFIGSIVILLVMYWNHFDGMHL